MTSPTTIMKKGKQGVDGIIISHLPDEILHHIVSSLSFDEAVRTSILSKKWIPLWRHASHLDFDETHMIKPLSMLRNPNSDLFNDEVTSKYLDIAMDTLLNHYLGNLTSCRFKHFPESLHSQDLKDLVNLVVEVNKNLSSLTLECCCDPKDLEAFDQSSRLVKLNFHHEIFSNLCLLHLKNYVMERAAACAFKGCENLKTLKMEKMIMGEGTINDVLENCSGLERFSLVESTGFKKLKIRNPNLKFLELRWLITSEIDVSIENLQEVVLDSLVCPTKDLKIDAVNLRKFCFCCSIIAQKVQAECSGQSLIKTQDILENCSDLFVSRTTNIFRNLLTMSIDLDLNNIREILALSFVLRSCIRLQSLEITIPAGEEDSYSSGYSDDDALPFSKPIFWEKRPVVYNCIDHELKFVILRGFTGKEQEVKFVEHLITRGTMMKKITIFCDSSVMAKVTGLLSLQRASIYLSIILKSHEKIEDDEAVKDRLSDLKSTHEFYHLVL